MTVKAILGISLPVWTPGFYTSVTFFKDVPDQPCDHLWTRQVVDDDGNIIDPPLSYTCLICGATATEEELDAEVQP